MRARTAALLARTAAVFAALTVASLGASPSAGASTGQLALFQAGSSVMTDPAGTLATLHSLGVGVVRVAVFWNSVAPDAHSHRSPSRFDAADPSAYPQGNWRPYDRIVQDARQERIAVDFVLGGGAPLWATGPHTPKGAAYAEAWMPSARAFGAFARAAGVRYSGRYRPCTSCAPLPPVRTWELWNEPNFGEELAPQATDGSRVSSAPRMYRNLLDSAWGALQGTGHGRDTILIGSLSPRGLSGPVTARWPEGLPGNFSTTKPLPFTRTLYCVDGVYRPLSGAAARSEGCPTGPKAAARFRAQHPGLFKASGFAIHPYPLNLPPTEADSRDPGYVEFSEIPRLATTLDRLQRVYGSRTRFPIYNTEYGYITDPPNHEGHYVSPATAAYYLNWGEYLSWRNPRVTTTMQFLLTDPNPTGNVPEYGGFATGLILYSGRKLPVYDAYRMPIFLPRTTVARGQRIEVWGCVRPAHTAPGPQSVAIQFLHDPSGRWQTITTVPIRSPRGYFDVRLKLPSSGSLRLAWPDPGGPWLYSRVVRLTLR
jgi:hypothetical protein